MRTGRLRQLGLVAVAPLALALVSALPATADEPPVTSEAPATTVVDGIEVGVGEALVPPAVATVEVPAERTAVAVVDEVEVGVAEALVPPPAVAAPATTVAPQPPPADDRAVAEVATVALVLAAWG